MNSEKLKLISYKDSDEIAAFIVQKELELSDKKSKDLIDFLSTINFSPMKYEILQDDSRNTFRKILLGLTFSQIDVLSFREPAIRQSVLDRFTKSCKLLGIDKKFISPITGFSEDIIKFWD